MWKIYAERLESSDLTGSIRAFQRIEPSLDSFVKSIKGWFVFYGNPPLDSLRLDVYELNTDGTLGAVIATSDKAYNLSDVKSDSYAAKEVWFEYSPPLLLKGGDAYAVAPRANSYTSTSTDHIAWVRAWPDPAILSGYTATMETLGRAPFKIAFLGKEEV